MDHDPVLIADLRAVARAAAVLLRDAAEAAETGRRLDPTALRASAGALDEVADRPMGAAVTDPLADAATEYRVHIPDHGGETLLIRRESWASGDGWAVSTYGRGGGLAWTAEGWQDSISALALDRLFCWPDAATAVEEARRALATTPTT